MRDKLKIAEKKEELLQITGEFCDRCLNEEYKQLCEQLILKMSRKRQVPFLTGQIDIWAAAILYALGQVNFLFVRRSEPYMRAGDLCQLFGRSMGCLSAKAKTIREMFRMDHWSSEFLTESSKKRNLLPRMAEMIRLLHASNVKFQEKELQEEPAERISKKPAEKKESEQKSLDDFG